MRIVVDESQIEIELDPVKAMRRGMELDAVMRGTLPPYPRGVTRGTHEYFNRIDDARRAAAAPILNVTQPTGQD